MYTIEEKESGQWVSAACVGQDEWKEGDTHFTMRIDKAACYHTKSSAYTDREKLTVRFTGKTFVVRKTL